MPALAEQRLRGLGKMPDNRSGLFYASGVIVLALAIRSLAPPCPLSAAADAAGDKVIADPTWGTVVNMRISPRKDGDQFTTTDNPGRHRALTTFKIATAGRYRLSIETGYETASAYQLEIGGPGGKPYARLVGDLRKGAITEQSGDIQASGVEPLPTATGHYRWWIDVDLPPGQVSFNASILSYENSSEFVGTPSSCQVVFDRLSLTPAGG